MLKERLRKRSKHLRKWARRTNVTCYRVYERDIPEFPCIVDWYDGEAVLWVYSRKKDESDDAKLTFQNEVIDEVKEGFELGDEKIHLKSRFRQKGDEGRQQYEKFNEYMSSKP